VRERWCPIARRHRPPVPVPSGNGSVAPDAVSVAWAGVNPTLTGRELQAALRRAIATRRGACDWTVDHAGWDVTLLSPEEETV
jgi:hypothetical protein